MPLILIPLDVSKALVTLAAGGFSNLFFLSQLDPKAYINSIRENAITYFEIQVYWRERANFSNLYQKNY
jgi:hypothetical protein